MFIGRVVLFEATVGGLTVRCRGGIFDLRRDNRRERREGF
jgi:hypothetical protein